MYSMEKRKLPILSELRKNSRAHYTIMARIAKIGISTFQEHLRKAELKLLPVIIEYQMKQN